MDARDPKQRMSYRIGRLFVVLSLAASWTAHAVLDQVAPETVPVYTSRMCITGHPISSCLANTLREACDLYYQVNMAGGYIVPNPAPVFTGIVGGYGQLQYTYSCLYNFYYMHNVSSVPYQAYHQDSELAIVDVTPPLCPAATPAYKFNAVSGMCERDICPANSSGTFPDACTCNKDYEPDPSKTSCVSTCKVDRLPDLPKDDACAQSLNKGLGKDVDGKCPELDARMTGANGQLQCFANKIAATNVSAWSKIPYDGPTATIRNTAYQKHLQNIWDKLVELDKLSDPAEISACQSLRDKVIAEKGCSSSTAGCGIVCTTGNPSSHCIDYRPTDTSNHSAGTAFDVSRGTINRLLTVLTPLPPAPMTSTKLLQARRFWVANWLAKPPGCNLDWGGSFTNPGPDFVHFQLP